MNNLLNKLLKGKSPANFKAFNLASKAYYRADRNQYLEAAVLFEAAATQGKYEFENNIDIKTNDNGIRINEYLNYYARAGFNFYEAGQVEKAVVMLKYAVTQNWLDHGLNNDLITILHSYNYLVLYEAGDKEEFYTAYKRAVWNCKKIKFDFPEHHAFQEKYFSIALKYELYDICDGLIEKFKTRRPKKRIPVDLIESYNQLKAHKSSLTQS